MALVYKTAAVNSTQTPTLAVLLGPDRITPMTAVADVMANKTLVTVNYLSHVVAAA